MSNTNATKTNFIIIYCDDLGYGDLECYGSEDARTPHINCLAEEGVRFTNWYSNSPVCSASRASLLTGRYPQTAGVGGILFGRRGTSGLRTDIPTLADVFQANGYRTSLFGKWHLGSQKEGLPNARGFDEFYGFQSGCIDYYSHLFYYGQTKGLNPLHDLWHNEEEVWENGAYMTDLITDKTVAFIEHQAGRHPFFSYVAYNAPHYPMHAPKEYMVRFAHLPWDKQVMYAMIAAVDEGVGRIVDALKRTKQYENTVIFFSSDNGPSREARNWMDGSDDKYYGGSAGSFRGHKYSLFDGGIREPAILFAPQWTQGGQVNEEIGVMMDVFPTLVEMAGIEASPEVDGVSIVPMISKGLPSPHDYVCWKYQDQLAVRQGNWKLVVNGRVDADEDNKPEPIQLSDLSNDPGERMNVAESQPDRVRQMMKLLHIWEKEVAP